MPLLIIVLGITFLLILILGFKVNAFIALILVSLGVGLAMGMSPIASLEAMQKGVGSTLGSLALIIGLGAMLGGLIAESGAAQVITNKLTATFGVGKLNWVMMLTGFIVGIPMFYNVAFLIVLPIIFAMSKETKMPILYIGLPAIAALSVTHGFLPPHPAPTTIVEFYGANLQLTLLYGLMLAIPTVLLSGIVFGRAMKKLDVKINEKLFKFEVIPIERLPSFGISVLVALVPVLLMGAAAIGQLTLNKENGFNKLLQFLGDPVMSLLLALILAVFTLGKKSGQSFGNLMDGLSEHVKPIAMIMLILAGGGAFKQVLVDSGSSEYIVHRMQDMNMPPLIMAWTVAAVLRIALGSATVAAMTAAGILQPLVAAGGVSPELLVLATGAGSLTCSQVNDTGFWMFKEYFNLTVVETFKSWTVMESIISVVGLAGCLLLDLIV
jgi:gluconate transporter